MSDKGRGSYMGTEMDGTWWRRYMRRGFFMRGAGEWWIEDGCFSFRRWLTRKPLKISLRELRRIELGSWHSGKWAAGRRVIKLVWEADGHSLSSGFILTRTAQQAEALAEDFRRQLGS